MTATRQEFERQIRSLAKQSHLTPADERRLSELTRDLSSVVGHPVSITRGGESVCISVDVTPRSIAPARSRSASRADGIPTYILDPRRATTWSKPKPAPVQPHRTEVERRSRRADYRYRAFKSGALDLEHLWGASYGVKRDIAEIILETELRDLSPSASDRLDSLLRRTDGDVNGRHVADWLIVCGTSAYAETFRKAITEPSPAWTPEEGQILNLYRDLVAPRASIAQRAAGEGGSFGLAIPVGIDPAVVTGGGLDEIALLLSLAKVVQTTSNVYKGVNSTGGTGFTLPGEGVVVGDGTPTFTQPSVDIFTLSDFIPHSIELSMDYPGFASEMGSMFARNYSDRVSRDTATGAGGTTAPQGIFTGLVGVRSSTVHVTTSGTIGAIDVRKAWSTLPERMKSDSSCAWHMSNSVWQQISALGAPSVTNGLSPHDVGTFADGSARLFGKPCIFSSYDMAYTNTTGTQNYAVVGAFSRFVIAQRIAGVTIELVPQLRDTSTGRPTGQRGLLAFARYGSGVLDPASFVVLTN